MAMLMKLRRYCDNWGLSVNLKKLLTDLNQIKWKDQPSTEDQSIRFFGLIWIRIQDECFHFSNTETQALNRITQEDIDEIFGTGRSWTMNNPLVLIRIRMQDQFFYFSRTESNENSNIWATVSL